MPGAVKILGNGLGVVVERVGIVSVCVEVMDGNNYITQWLVSKRSITLIVDISPIYFTRLQLVGLYKTLFWVFMFDQDHLQWSYQIPMIVIC